MKKVIFLSSLMFCLAVTGYSQTSQKKTTPDKPEIIKDRFIVDVFHSFWMGTPSEVNVNKLHPGFNIAGIFDFKVAPKSPFSFGLGIGVTYYSQFSNGLLQRSSDSIMRYHVIPENIEYNYNRMSYVSCNIPLEFRYRHHSGFKATLGVRLGLVAEISQRYKGSDPLGSSDQINRKSYEIYNKQKFNFDVYMRAGWKYVSLYYCYQVTSLFENGKGPKMSPMSLGFTWNIF